MPRPESRRRLTVVAPPYDEVFGIGGLVRELVLRVSAGSASDPERLEGGSPFLGAQFGEGATCRRVSFPERRFIHRP